MLPDVEDDENAPVESEEFIVAKRELKASTQKIIRQFAKREHRLLL